MVNKGFFLSIGLPFDLNSWHHLVTNWFCSFVTLEQEFLSALIWVAFTIPGLHCLQMLVRRANPQSSGVLHWPTTFQGVAFHFSSLPPFTLFSSLLLVFVLLFCPVLLLLLLLFLDAVKAYERIIEQLWIEVSCQTLIKVVCHILKWRILDNRSEFVFLCCVAIIWDRSA